MSRTLCAKIRHHIADDVQNAEDINGKISSGFFVGEFLQGSHLSVTGVIDYDIDFAERVERFLNRFSHAFLV